jgi:hypothetical protein
MADKAKAQGKTESVQTEPILIKDEKEFGPFTEAVQISPIHVDYVPPEPAKQKKLYWFGTIPGSFFQGLGAGGFEFPGYTETQERNVSTGEMTWVSKAGGMAWLDDDKVEHIKKAVLTKVVREIGPETGDDGTTKKRALQLNVASEQYVPNKQKDRPIACYVYLVPLQKEQDWPNMDYFIDGTKIPDGTPVQWGNPEHFHMDRFPLPMARVVSTTVTKGA